MKTHVVLHTDCLRGKYIAAKRKERNPLPSNGEKYREYKLKNTNEQENPPECTTSSENFSKSFRERIPRTHSGQKTAIVDARFITLHLLQFIPKSQVSAHNTAF